MCGRVSYEVAFWVIYLITSIPIILDRFTTNYWPRQTFHFRNYSTSSDKLYFVEGPWSVRCYDVVARFSGRYFMLALNALFFTMLHTLHRSLKRTYLGRYIIDFSDDGARRRVHKWVGISICVFTLLHVWSILFPVIFSGYDVRVVPGIFTWPLSENTPKGFKDVSYITEMVMMQADDVYRLILMTVLLGPVVFLSYRWLSTNYRVGIRVHQFVVVMYFIDIVRRHSHPHSWVLNTPFFLMWIADLICGHYYLHKRMLVYTIDLSSNYMLILWKCDKTEKSNSESDHTIGDLYYLRKAGTFSCVRMCSDVSYEKKHPFTSFNKRGCKLPSKRYMGGPKNYVVAVDDLGRMYKNKMFTIANEFPNDVTMADELDWNRGVILRTYPKKNCQTRLMRESEALFMDTWGYFCSGSYRQYLDSQADVVLVGGGSGSGYLLDTLMYLCRDNKCEKGSREDVIINGNVEKGDLVKSIVLIFTSKDLELVEWWTSIIDGIVSENKLPVDANIKVTVSLSRGEGADNGVKEFFSQGEDHSSLMFPWGKVVLGRCDMEKEMLHMNSGRDRGKHAFCQGGTSLQAGVRNAAKHSGFKYHECHSFDSGSSSGLNIKLNCCKG